PLLGQAAQEINAQKEEVARLASVASQHPFYQYNHAWSRELQDLVFSILFWAWLGGDKESGSKLMTIEDVGRFLDVPVNLKDKDEFHLTIEEYLFALISLIDELSRLAVNSVTLDDYARPLEISKFIGDLHSGFQLLNLKNGALRQRSDSIKYSV
ncbi:hypothetical protein KEM55_005073, partial [Ascosphaera atra]